mgnify:CR=1 FL=1
MSEDVLKRLNEIDKQLADLALERFLLEGELEESAALSMNAGSRGAEPMMQPSMVHRPCAVPVTATETDFTFEYPAGRYVSVRYVCWAKKNIKGILKRTVVVTDIAGVSVWISRDGCAMGRTPASQAVELTVEWLATLASD